MQRGTIHNNPCQKSTSNTFFGSGWMFQASVWALSLPKTFPPLNSCISVKTVQARPKCMLSVSVCGHAAPQEMLRVITGAVKTFPQPLPLKSHWNNQFPHLHTAVSLWLGKFCTCTTRQRFGHTSQLVSQDYLAFDLNRILRMNIWTKYWRNKQHVPNMHPSSVCTTLRICGSNSSAWPQQHQVHRFNSQEEEELIKM